MIKNSYNKDFNIDSITSKNGYVKALTQERQAGSCKLQLEITPPPLTARGLYFRDVLSVNIEGGTKLNVAIVGYYSKDVGK